MRKIKIFLTMLAVAGVLFATTSSCVDNTESDSVAQLRKAKAAELNANADYLKAKATIDQTLATAEAALLQAQAKAAEAQVAYLAALGKKEEALGEAEKLKAEADKIRAQAALATARGDSLYFAAQAAKLEADAAKVIADTKIAVDQAEEALRVTIAQNEVILAQQKALLEQAELDAKIALAGLQLEYLRAIGNLELEVARKYAELLGYLNAELNNITLANRTITQQTIAIANYESNLAWAKLDSVRANKQQIAYYTQYKVRDSLYLVSAKYRLSVYEAEDGGVAVAAEAKQALVEDTIAAFAALDEAKAEAAAKKAAFEAVTPAYETALANYTTASDNLLNYNSVAAGSPGYSFGNYTYYYNVPSVTSNGKTYSPSDLISDNWNTSWYPEHGYGYKHQWAYLEDLENLTYIEVSVSDYFDIIDGVDQPINRRVASWYVYPLTKYYNIPDIKYVSVEQLTHDIERQKVDTAEKAVLFAKAAVDLRNSIDSLIKYSALELSTTAAAKAATKARDDAETALEAARIVFEAAKTKGENALTATGADTIAWENAAKDYNWKDIDGSDLRGINSDSDVSKQNLYNNAVTALNNANTAHNNAFIQYNSYLPIVRTNIQAHIDAKDRYEGSVVLLTSLESYKPILELGTRDKLVFALQEAEAVLVALKKDYIKAEDESVIADRALGTAQSRYDVTIEVLADFEEWYSKWIVGEITTAAGVNINIGNYLDNLATRANNIGYTQRQIADLENSIARYEKYIADVSEVGASYTSYYYEAIATAQAEIEAAKKQKAEAEQKAKFYQDAIDAFLSEYGE
jgi:hypothetical protein